MNGVFPKDDGDPLRDCCINCAHWRHRNAEWGYCRSAEMVWSLARPEEFPGPDQTSLDEAVAGMLRTHAVFCCNQFDAK